MSLEAKIEALTAAVVALNSTLRGTGAVRLDALTPEQVTALDALAPVPSTLPTVPTPVAPPIAEAVIQPAPPMPAPPTFVAPPAPAAPALPFSDMKGLTDYTMKAFQALGPRGQEIQGVLQAVGVANLNEVTPDKYAAFFAGVEALKA